MDLSQRAPDAEVSMQTSGPPVSRLSRVLWRVCLAALGSVLTIHAALAYAPDLARYLPDSLLANSKPTSSCHATETTGCGARPVLAGDFSACCVPLRAEPPVLTDSLYPDERTEAMSDRPADAFDCIHRE